MACGRIGFDRLGGDANLSDGATGDTPPPPPLACGETILPGGGLITGSALRAVVTTRGLAAMWIDPGGALLGVTWSTEAGDIELIRNAVPIAAGPFSDLRAAANGDEILIATQEPSALSGRIVAGDFTPIHPSLSLGSGPLAGRHPYTHKRGAPGFVAITQAGEQPAVFEIPEAAVPMAYLLTSLQFHSSPSIAADSDGYAIVTERADQFGPGCWYSKISDTFAFVSGPGTLESTQQADCDSSIVVASAGPLGAAMAWMDRDPVNSYAEFQGTAGGGGVASMSGEVNVRSPVVTSTSTGFAVLYAAGTDLRVVDAGGARTLAPASALADLVTWGDRAIVVWTSPEGFPELTRLCPAPAR
jgi:hypothetical protein